MIFDLLKQGADCAVLGFGRSGRAATDFLLERGAKVTVFDQSAVKEDLAEAYRMRGVQFRMGEFPPVFAERILVRSPVIRPDIPPILASVRAGAVLTGEAELFAACCPAPIIAVTGSDGKTTTTALIGALLQGSGRRVFCGGNNGVPLLPKVGEIRASDVVAMELSSFQLMTMEFSPAVAVLTNLSPNHLNWHRDMAEYIGAKCRIFQHAGRLVTNGDCPLTRGIAEKATLPVTLFHRTAAPEWAGDHIFPEKGKVHLFQAGEERVYDCGAFRLIGAHNKENLLAALAAALPLPAGVGEVLAGFAGVPHRLQYVDTVGGVSYYNSSIDTSPTRTAAALDAFGAHPLVIAGGRGKGISLLPLADALAAHAKAVFLYGETAEELEAALAGRIPTVRAFAFADAFAAAAGSALPGDAVLLSPGCTAFGEFRDFEERGETFIRLVASLPRKG